MWCLTSDEQREQDREREKEREREIRDERRVIMAGGEKKTKRSPVISIP